jgi:ribonuclease VapC
MVIDSSVLIAILQQDVECAAFVEAIRRDPIRLLSPVAALEASIVIEARKGPAGGRDLDLLLHRSQAEVVPFSAEQLEIARAACRRYGKGVHPAALKFGDCCSYALARVSGEPLLAKRERFAKTDVALVA